MSNTSVAPRKRPDYLRALENIRPVTEAELFRIPNFGRKSVYALVMHLADNPFPGEVIEKITESKHPRKLLNRLLAGGDAATLNRPEPGWTSDFRALYPYQECLKLLPEGAETSLYRIPGVGPQTVYDLLRFLHGRSDRLSIYEAFQNLSGQDHRRVAARLVAEDRVEALNLAETMALQGDVILRQNLEVKLRQQAQARASVLAAELGRREKASVRRQLEEILSQRGVDLDGAPPVVYSYAPGGPFPCPTCRRPMELDPDPVVVYGEQPVYKATCPVHKDRLAQAKPELGRVLCPQPLPAEAA